MINLDDVTGENAISHNRNYSYILDHPYKMLIADSSGSGKTSALFNLNIIHQAMIKLTYIQRILMSEIPIIDQEA